MPPLLRLALPLILGELGWMSMSVVDTIMVGRLPNSAVAMSAAALAQVLFNTLCFGVGGILLALDTLISQAFGAKQTEEANRWLLHGLVLATALAALLTGMFLASSPLLRHLPATPEIIALAIPAMRGLAYGTLPLLLYFTLRRYLQAAHHARSIAYALITANLVNAALDWLLIYGHKVTIAGASITLPSFGVEGSAWATSIARLYLMVFLLAAVLLLDRRHHYGLLASTRDRTRRRIELRHLRRLLVLGSPAGASIFVEIAIFALVTTLIANFGPLSLAGHEVALQVASTTFMVPFAISAATSVRVGHAVGRSRSGLGPASAIAAAGWSGIIAGAGFMLAASVVLLVMPGPIARIFTPDRAVIAAAVPLLLVASGFQFFDGLQITITGALRGVGNTTSPLYTQIVCYWIIGMPLGMWFSFHAQLGAFGLWLGLLFALAGASIALMTVWLRTTASLQNLALPTSKR